MSNIIFDIDGTLRNFEKELDIDPTLYKYLLLLKNKHTYYIATGKTYSNYLNFIKELEENDKQTGWGNLFNIVFCEDGHICYKNDRPKLLITKKDLEQIKIIKQYFKENIKEFENKYFVNCPSRKLIGQATLVIQEQNNCYLFKNILSNFIINNKLDRLTINLLTHNRLSITIKNINKNSAVQAYKLDLTDTFYFCDESNDIKLANTIISAGGKIICPNNAAPELKRVAYYISNKNYSYGVVDFLSSFFCKSSN